MQIHALNVMCLRERCAEVGCGSTGLSVWPSTTSCCALRRSWEQMPCTPARNGATSAGERLENGTLEFNNRAEL